MLSEKIVGIDIGGTKISIGILVNGKIEQFVKLETPADGTKEEVMQQIVKGIESLEGYEDAAGIGIGAPGLIDEKEGVIFSVTNIPSWREVHLKSYLEDHFKKPVYITNDANCFAIGVKIYGEGQPFKNVICLALGTGVGAGVVIDGYLYSGEVAGAGEVGGLPYLDADFETYCSGKFFKQINKVDGQTVFEKAQQNDPEALKMFAEFGRHVGNLIKTTIFMMAPEAVIVGGSVSNSYEFWKDAMMESVQEFPYKKVIENFQVLKTEMNDIAVIGAAALFKNRYEQDMAKAQASKAI
ncbi:ROK family protein [Mangrovibacterium diazotrophicum]|uniref:Glucokinase n=1 Tax=Mangrovibacterium diazotrophicum TaxID=1261403 RepID=A0A419W496_9BACT|nr:ROK family protein [Mangrovibacterium diazotrophicum]RKD90267.1 glucokinase [Mangrovibacterium diazotrophicum]